jgi:hypothetical protein
MFAGLAIAPMVAWTVVTVLDNNVNCWVIDKKDKAYMYILDGPRIFKLVVSPYLMA